MGIQTYAKHKGVAESVVRNAMDTGRITFENRGGRRLINPEVADREWDQNKMQGGDLTPPEDAGSDFKPSAMFESRLAHQTLKAQLAQVELNTKLGKLVDVEKVKQNAYKIGRALRDAIRLIPAKISAELAAETDPHKVEILLQRELDEALTELSRMEI